MGGVFHRALGGLLRLSTYYVPFTPLCPVITSSCIIILSTHIPQKENGVADRGKKKKRKKENGSLERPSHSLEFTQFSRGSTGFKPRPHSHSITLHPLLHEHLVCAGDCEEL